jgi:deuterolysin
MKITLSQFLALAATANCAAINLETRATPLDVKLTSLGNSKVKAEITNNGASSYNLFYKGTFLDTEAPVDKFHVSTSGSLSFYDLLPDYEY